MSSPIVETKQGKVQGKICEDHEGNVYFAFLGIPFAKPPLGNLRFKAPQPPEPWEGVRDATEDGSRCYSFDYHIQKAKGSEDCLFVNVYTNEVPLNENNLKPVMVYIYGGAFTSGSNESSRYGPDFIICEDVVLVCINYRVGALGFLSLKDPKLGVPGNAGLKDMVMALKWVKNNIQSFNGDPNNVTIFGESAGAAAVHYLVLSPMAKDLFHKAIALSGCATNVWACGKTGGEDIASNLDLKSKNEEEILELLQNVTKEELLTAQLKTKDTFSASKVRNFGPVVEKRNFNEECFLHEEPINVIRSGKYNKVPLIMGYTSEEGILFECFEKMYQSSFKLYDFETTVPYTLGLPQGSTLSLNVASQIKNFYFGAKDPTSNEAIKEFYKLQTDNFFLRDILLAAIAHKETSNTPVYFYRFSVDAELNFYKKWCESQTPGACHADDLGYLFKNQLTPEIRPGSLEEITYKRYVKYLTNFAKRGDPNPIESDELFPVLWKPITKDRLHFVDIGENLTVGCNPESHRIKFWDSILKLFK